ncbi:MAG: hypothetical protein HUK16_04650 [Bacteroidales bacterium]|nr:hypothetical protein [Bacteroidales bacterium]
MDDNYISNALTPIQKAEEFASVVNMIRQAHSNVMRMANTVLIDLYWNLGKHISERVATAEWGKGVVAQLANYITENEPNTKGFSAQNLWRMKQFYETYRNNEKLSSMMREISWTNNLIIMSKAKNDEEVVEYALSRTLSPTLVAQYELALPDKKMLQQRVHEIYQQSLEELENGEDN